MKSAAGRRLEDFLPLMPGEEQLRDHARCGTVWNASSQALQTLGKSKGDESWVVRAEFLRFLILGGDDDTPVHERGPRAKGAFLRSNLDLTGCKGMRMVRLRDCYLQGRLNLENAGASSISLDGSSVERIDGDRATINGSIYMRFGFEARDGVDLSGCNVTGSISCRGGIFRSKYPMPTKSPGTAGPSDNVDLPDAASVGGGLERVARESHPAFRLDDAEVSGALILGPRSREDGNENYTEFHGRVSLKGTNCAALVDHPRAYQKMKPGWLQLHGFRYGRLPGVEPATAGNRIEWLRKQFGPGTYHQFSSQPFEHLAGILREMGHETSARRILIERRRLHHLASQERRKGQILNSLSGRSISAAVKVRIVTVLVGLWNQILDSLVRYGYEPARAIAWSMIPLVTGWLVFGVAYQAGHMVPNSFVSTRKEWIACKDISSLSPQLGLKTFVSELFRRENSVDKCLHYRPPYTPGVDAAPAAGLVDYPQFNPFWYTLDTFLPIVSLHQEEHWTPGPKSSIARHYLTVHILLGWLMVTLGLSGMLGLIQRRATSALR